MACNLACPFCFSKSSVSSLDNEYANWNSLPVEQYYEYAAAHGATRLVITGGGEPLLRPRDVVSLISRARPFFAEIACFTNGTFLTEALAEELAGAGLTYLCYSRHHHEDELCARLMGHGTPRLEDFVQAAGPLKIRATCVMAQGFIDSPAAVWSYIETLVPLGVREFTFKHTYVAFEHSVFGASLENDWARRHRVAFDPFEGQGETVFQLPWGPRVRRVPFGSDTIQVCYYQEPTPAWEQENRLCRSTNLLSDGTVYASLEDHRSRLFQLKRC
ncbi:MAG: radical SAM protein [Planctomycetes bacterium]|nr:radical SAM protein [Planctomycetota bacterium]